MNHHSNTFSGDLFAAPSDFDLYPQRPGHKGDETSAAAAEDMAPRAPRIRQLVLDAITRAGAFGRTSEELAEELEMPRVTVQPRTSELKADGRIVKSKATRPNASSGKAARVFILPQYAEAEVSQ